MGDHDSDNGYSEYGNEKFKRVKSRDVNCFGRVLSIYRKKLLLRLMVKIRKNLYRFSRHFLHYYYFQNISIFIFPFVIMFTKNEHGIYSVHHFFRTPTADFEYDYRASLGCISGG